MVRETPWQESHGPRRCAIREVSVVPLNEGSCRGRKERKFQKFFQAHIAPRLELRPAAPVTVTDLVEPLSASSMCPFVLYLSDDNFHILCERCNLRFDRSLRCRSSISGPILDVVGTIERDIDITADLAATSSTRTPIIADTLRHRSRRCRRD